MNFFETRLTAIDCAHAVDNGSLIHIEVLHLFVENLSHHLHIKHFHWLYESYSMLVRYIPAFPHITDLLVGIEHFLCILVKLDSFSLNLILSLVGRGFLLPAERTIFVLLWYIHGQLTVLRSRVTTHLWSTALVLATSSLRYTLYWLCLLGSTDHVVVRIIVRFLTVLWPHFQVVNQFILNFATWVLDGLHGHTILLPIGRSTRVLAPLTLSNIVTMMVIRCDGPFIQVRGRKSVPLVIMHWSLVGCPMLARIVRLTLSLWRSNATRLHLGRVRISSGTWCVDLVQVLVKTFLPLQARQITCRILVFCNTILRYGTWADLTSILPITL